MNAFARFHEHGWMRLPGAIAADACAAMCDALWSELESAGIARNDPASWTVERPAHLQRLRDHPAFRAIGSPAVLAAIETLMQGQAWEQPKNWGSPFVAFPQEGEWELPVSGWHIDAKYTSSLDPPGGVKVLALFDDVVPRGGTTLVLGGSHRTVHSWFVANPPPADARSADMRRLLLGHPYIRDLQTPGSRTARIARFMDRAETVDGIPLEVVEAAGSAGDVFLLHPLTMHAASPNASTHPRMMLSGGVTSDMWGWG